MAEQALVKAEPPAEGALETIRELKQDLPPDLYHGLAARPFSGKQAEVLMKAVATEDLDILPTGEVYLTQVKYRQRLNEAFGPGGWALRPLGKTIVKDNSLMREYALYADGRFVSQAVGESDYIPNNPRMTYATALEALKSNALMRCCKDIGIASECWDRHFTEVFKHEHCIQVWRKNSAKPQWRRKDAEPWFDEAGQVQPQGNGGQAAPSTATQPAQMTREWKELKARHPGKCAICETPIAVGQRIFYNYAERQVHCENCGPADNETPSF